MSSMTFAALSVVFGAMPAAARAEVCDTLRPDWTPGAQATALDEAMHLFSTPPAVTLLVATASILRFRNPWLGLAVVCGWSLLVSMVAFDLTSADATGQRQRAIAEGCIASPALFIAAVTAICIATILYTAPLRGRSSG